MRFDLGSVYECVPNCRCPSRKHGKCAFKYTAHYFMIAYRFIAVMEVINLSEISAINQFEYDELHHRIGQRVTVGLE